MLYDQLFEALYYDCCTVQLDSCYCWLLMTFFDRGMIVADFRQDRMMDLGRDKVKIFVKSWFACSFSTHPVTPSGPGVFLGSSL